MARIGHVMQAKAAFDAACQDMAWAYAWECGGLEAAANRITRVLEEVEKRCIRVLLEEEETPAMMMIQEESQSIGDWLTSVKDVANNMRAYAREILLRDDTKHGFGKLIARMMLPCLAPKTTEVDILEKIIAKLEALMGLPLASCYTEQPSCVGQQSFITDVPLGNERDDDKKTIIDMITQHASPVTDEPVILPIFGPAGVGKTTLVKSIFHDPKLFQGYAKAWVDTLEGRDLEKIYTSIISSQALQGAESSPLQDDYSVDGMKNQLAELFRSGNKKLLLVLDDLWVQPDRWGDEDNLSRMDDLKSLLCGTGGNLVVIVTTPSKSIAGCITSTAIEPYQLHPLSHDTCWAIIKQTSGFEARIAGNHQEAEAAERIGREIASNCGGLPLAAKAIGRTMRSVDNPQDWSALVGDTSNIGGGYSGDSQLPLHTLTVPSHLEQAYHISPLQWLCFATCAFCFSKGHSISRYDMRWLWRALHIDYFDPWYLLDHSLLRENSASNASAVLKDAMLVSADDMMYDFARYVLGDRLMVVDGRRNDYLAERSSNAYLVVISNWDANQRLDLSSILPAGILALRFEDCPAKMELSDGAFVFSSAEHLLVLDLSGCSLKKLPESIGELKRLRYLNARGIQDRVLPLWLTRLDGLIYLSLRGSPLLSDLTEAFGRLQELRHLDLSGCSGLKALPDSFGGHVCRLEHLDLSSCSGLKALPDSFGRGWRLRHLDLSGCSGLKALPDSFGRLQELEHLDLSGWSCVGGITEALERFPWLQYLNLSHRCGYSSVEDWFHLKDLHEVLPQFFYLRFLGLASCLNPLCYTSTPDKSNNYVDRCIRQLVRLHHLDLSHNKFLVQLLPESIADLKELRSLDLSGCFRLESVPESIGNLKELRSLDLSGCFRLERLPERIGELKKLETLDLSGCPQFHPLPENVQQNLAKLRSQGSLTIITDHLCQAGAHEAQSQARSIVAGDDEAQGRASTPQDASFLHQSSAAEPEITEATDEDQ